MRTIGLLLGVIAAIALAGCQSIGTRDFTVPPTAFKCTYETDCVVTVHVTDTNPCVISVDRPEIEIKGSSIWHGGVTHLIRWELDEYSEDAKFRFDRSKGVVLKQPDTADQFSGQGPQSADRQYHWRDRNTNVASYPYDINIVKKGSPSITCKLDPMFFNN